MTAEPEGNLLDRLSSGVGIWGLGLPPGLCSSLVSKALKPKSSGQWGERGGGGGGFFQKRKSLGMAHRLGSKYLNTGLLVLLFGTLVDIIVSAAGQQNIHHFLGKASNMLHVIRCSSGQL